MPIERAQQPMAYTRTMPDIAPQVWAQRGQVISSDDETSFDMAKLPSGSKASTMIYRSTSGIDGAPTVVSGALFVPPGDAPDGGWPVISYAHYTTGVSQGCGPTADKELAGSISFVGAILGQGYAVAYTDYVGLGDIGAEPRQVHPYLEPKSAAFNVIDAVRAARTLDPELSDRWVAVGNSQGGQAAFAAAEYGKEYGDGTQLLGSAAVVPALDASRLGDPATLTDAQKSVFPLLIAGLSAVDPEIIPTDYLPEGSDQSVSCAPGPVQPKDASPEAVARLTERLASYALPQIPTQIPIAVYYGGNDQLIRPEWTEEALQRACDLGDTIEATRVDDGGHDLNPGDALTDWVKARFAGEPAPSDC
jgi:pimeloyl-ACP methyl ester carboxylesterase